MIDTKKLPGRGRPRAFDPDKAIETAQALFHAKGYDGVGIAALTEALGINPPSFYAAFGSKAALFARVLERYAARGLPLDIILAPGRDPAEALTDLLETAARTYAASPAAAGCMVMESTRGSDPASVSCARTLKEQSRARVRDFLSCTHPAVADAVSDFVDVAMMGLSSNARSGWDEARLLGVAHIAGAAIARALEA